MRLITRQKDSILKKILEFKQVLLQRASKQSSDQSEAFPVGSLLSHIMIVSSVDLIHLEHLKTRVAN